MEAPKAKSARPLPRARAPVRARDDEASSSSSSGEEETPRRSSESSSSAESESSEASSSEASSSASESAAESMRPPPRPRVSTPPGSVIPSSGAGAVTPGNQVGEIETRPSRSESTASRTNRLSLTLPIALPSPLPSRPTPASSTAASFPGTPVDMLALGLASPAEPADLITAIAAQERRVLEIREELNRAESSLTELKKQWAIHEAHKKRAEFRKTVPMRSLPSRPGAASAAADSFSQAAGVGLDDAAPKKNELDRRKALLLAQQQPGGQHPGSQPGSDPNTPTQSRRRVFKGGHARALSLLSPTKPTSDGFDVHQDPTPSGEEASLKSPLSPLDLDSPFLQNLGRYVPAAATQLSKRASWAPQSVQQAAGAGIKQYAGDFTATIRTFVEDLRQATVGEELGGSHGTMRSIDPNSRATDDSTIRASASGRPNLARAFTADVQGTPTPPPRPSAAGSASEQPDDAGDKPGKAGAGSSSSNNSSKAKPTPKSTPKTANGKEKKRFSWAPLSVDSFDDDWSSWDTPTVKSPRWSGSTANSESVVPEQADENATPQKRNSVLSSFSPTSPSGGRGNDINWPAALNRLTPTNIKRTATDLMKEWEKSLSSPVDSGAGHTSEPEDRIL